MGVLVAMNEARKPTTWSWLFRADRPRTTRIDTRIDFDPGGPPVEPTVGQGSAATVEASARPKTVPDLAGQLAQVKDDTVWRPEERAAWFSLVDRLQQENEQELRDESLGVVGFVQLFRQSSEYRGRLVTVRGTAKLAYRVPAARNELGVQEYCLFWLQPEDGTNLPIVVYALEPPVGFPPLTRQQTALHEPLEVQGYFFKRWVYEAKDGLNSVPVLVAQRPAWNPLPAPSQTVTNRLVQWLGPWFGLAAILFVALLAAGAGGVAWLAHWATRANPVRAFHRPPEKLSSEEMHRLEQLPATPSLAESLRKLEE